ncbi:MAG: UTP--glucose-1-phosphate uridylyltransferase [Bacillus sp. (in: Bacteria)]|nr:UTP--glucose-1-phosphate uridylyltransferase [Bacillus sp. (in: firmicutes)]
MVKKAVIPAAGYGTRQLPITKVVPKEMFPIVGRPAIDYIIEEAVDAGIEEILIIFSRSKNMIMDYYDRSLELEAFLEQANKAHLLSKTKLPNIHIQFTRQPYANGLGDAVKLAKYFAGNDAFAVMLPDEIILNKQTPPLKQLMDVHKNYKGNVLALKQESESELKNYGVIRGRKMDKGLYELLDIVEKPKENPPSNLAVVGRYIFENNIFSYLEKQKAGVNGEVQLTDAIKEMIIDGRIGYGIEVEGERFDIGKDGDYLRIQNELS